MQKAGVDSFLTQKISWNEFNRFPHHTFLWEGIDGTRMFTHFPPADTYNGNFEARQLANSVRRFKENDRATRSLYPYGYGDGGGGPTRGMLEFARRFADFDGLPRVELEGPAAFFEKAKEDAVDPPVWVGELYLELHRATYTTQGRTKRGNRKSEILMRECEFADALDHILSPADQRDGPVLEQPERAVYDTWDYAWPRKRRGHAAALDRAWKLILLNQFHDIIPGSSIAWVYRDSDIDYGTVALLGEAVREDSLAHLRARFPTEGLEEPLLALNATDQARGEVAALPGGGLGWVEVPAFGHAVFDACAARQLPEGVRPARIETLDTGGFLLDNGRVRARVGPDGYLESLYDTENEREALAEGARGGELRLYDDRPYNWEAWDFALYALEKHEVLALSEMRVVEEGPMRVAVETLRRFGNSVLTQRIELRAGLRRVDFVTEADWHERKRLLRACFPVNVLSARATYEIPFGTVERPTHFNTSWDMARFETAGQRWADLSEGDYGVALLTDCKYGYAAIGNELGLSLLRGPEHPDPFADEGPHAFTYSLFPHAGDHRTGGVTEEAARLNQPAHLRALEPGNAGELPAEAAWFGVDRPGLYLDSVKLAEREEALIVRLYEGWGTRGAAELTTALPLKQARVANVMERDGETLELKDGTLRFEVKPYEIITFKFSF
jgi:alpha-mannosidase